MAEKGESAAAGEETGLKKELQKVVKVILEEDDYGIERTKEAITILLRLAELKHQKPVDVGRDDPAILSSRQDNMITEADRFYLEVWLGKLSSRFLSDQKIAANELRLLIETNPTYPEAFCELTDAISLLLGPLSGAERKVDREPELQEDLITTVLNLSIPEKNKKLVAENPVVLPVLIESMKFGTIETRRKAAAALFTLSELDSNKVLIGNSGALRPLLDLLREGPPSAMKDAASAIFNLCFVTNNKEMLADQGAVKLILQKINGGILVDELLGILAMLSTDLIAIRDLEVEGINNVKCILKIIRESSSEHTKENGITILHSVCRKDLGMLTMILIEDIERHTLAGLVETGTSEAKWKASGILERIKRITSPK
ncbi:hypothetical protein PTKIN_Ptkin06aG0169100 [Pterospermum kingtungense]